MLGCKSLICEWDGLCISSFTFLTALRMAEAVQVDSRTPNPKASHCKKPLVIQEEEL